MKKNLELLYGFSCFDQFMIVIPLLVPYLGSKGIGMAEFMELQAIFAIVIVLGEVPTGMLSDRWGRKRVLLLGSVLKAIGFSMLPLWSSYEGFLVYHLTMGVALSMISGGDVAFLYESYLAAGGEKSRGAAVLGNARLAGQIGAGVSALIGGLVATVSYDYLLWAGAVLGWIPVLLVLGLSETPAEPGRKDAPKAKLREILASVLVRDVVTRLVFVNIVTLGIAGLVMVWTNQKYWQESQVPLVYFGVLYAAYNLIGGFAGRLGASLAARYGRRAVLGVAGVLPVLAYFGMASFIGWGGIALGFFDRSSRAVTDVLLLSALNERISSAIRATVMSMASLGTRAGFAVIGPVAGFGIDAWGLPPVLVAVGLVYAAVFALVTMPLILRETASTPA
ncbi:MAG: MFS transporter [Rhodospirillaceae bacterium]|nr:MFS transporter [Rhodospirillaceae bacterium]